MLPPSSSSCSSSMSMQATARLLCFLLLTALIAPRQLTAAAAAAASRSKTVTSLPGFDGRLPFHLETGYVEVDQSNGAELFYYFVESESEAARGAGGKEDVPFVLWLTGGDRCSVFSGLVYEIGPIRFVVEPYNGTLPRLEINPNSWTKVAHILFVDSPVGAGFSFSRDPKGYEVGDVSSSRQLHEFLIKWFSDHPKYFANPFYIGGDSYVGKLVPFIAHIIISKGIQDGVPHLNLKGYLIGNSMTGEIVDLSSRVPFAHGFGIISDQLYERISKHCQEQDYVSPTNALCAQALDAFNHLLSEVQIAHILLDRCVYASPAGHPDDGGGGGGGGGGGRRIISEIGTGLKHPPPRPPFGCITYRYYLSYFWANTAATRVALGIKEGSVKEWVRCHGRDLPYTVDLKSSIGYHREVTTGGAYRALVYSGDHDALVPHLGTQAWVRSLGFPVTDGWRAWHLHGQSAGFTISYSNGMTFATIKGGGHTAPEYEPEKCFAMFSRWILNQPL